LIPTPWSESPKLSRNTPTGSTPGLRTSRRRGLFSFVRVSLSPLRSFCLMDSFILVSSPCFVRVPPSFSWGRGCYRRIAGSGADILTEAVQDAVVAVVGTVSSGPDDSEVRVVAKQLDAITHFATDVKSIKWECEEIGVTLKDVALNRHLGE